MNRPHGRRGGRRKGVGSYEKQDTPLVEKMKELIDSFEAASPHAAALQVVDRAKGGGTGTSKVRRLVNRFNDKYG